MLTATRARKRVVVLRVDAAPVRRAEAVHGRVRDHVDRLALPPSAADLAAYLPAVALLSLGAAIPAFGVAGLVGLGVVGAVSDAVLRRSAPRRRAAATERALPGVLDAVARHLRAGGSLAQAIAAARPPDTSPDPQRSWSRLTDLIPLAGVTAALDDWASSVAEQRPAGASPVGPPTSRAPRSIALAAAALSLAATTGGSPARAIDGVAATLRSRLAVADELRALSSQARASAVVIALAPVGFGLLAGATDERTRDFLASPPGLVLLTAGLILDALGAAWMSHLCRPPATAA